GKRSTRSPPRDAPSMFAPWLPKTAVDEPKPPTGTRVRKRIGFVVTTGAAAAVVANANSARNAASTRVAARRYRDADATSSTLAGARPMVASEETGAGREMGIEKQTPRLPFRP